MYSNGYIGKTIYNTDYISNTIYKPYNVGDTPPIEDKLLDANSFSLQDANGFDLTTADM